MQAPRRLPPSVAFAVLWLGLSLLLLLLGRWSSGPGASAPPTPTIAPVGSTGPGRATARAPTDAGQAAGPASTGAGLAARPASPNAVRLGTRGNLLDAPLYVAMARGFFRDQGLEVTEQQFDTLARMTELLGQSRLDVVSSAPSASLFTALFKRTDVQIVAGGGRSDRGVSPFDLVVRKSLVDAGQLETVAKLRGRRIAFTELHTSPAIELDRYLRLGAVALNQTQPVVLPAGDILVALANGNVDAFVAAEPTPTLAVAAGTGVRWPDWRSVQPNHQVGLMLFSPSFGRERPDVARRVLIAYLQGVRVYEAARAGGDRDELARLLGPRVRVNDLSLFDRMTWPVFDQDARLDLDSLRADEQWLLEIGAMRDWPNVAAFVDRAYLDAALTQLGADGQ
ncbi:MAG: ABC transporter substrate-binding protein [Chloroflexi bacterium]|nr:ABC transporter substrate-binding protein [Chloroflexota bacterium]